MHRTRSTQLTCLAILSSLTLITPAAYPVDLAIPPSTDEHGALSSQPVGLDGLNLPPDYALELDDIQIENFDLWDRIR